MLEHCIDQRFEDVHSMDSTFDIDRQTQAREFVDECHQSQNGAVFGNLMHEVIAGDMIAGCGRRRTQEPSVNQNRPRGRCFCNNLSQSRRQMRCTRSRLTCQPPDCSKAVMLR